MECFHVEVQSSIMHIEQTIPIVKELSHVFPDIDGELCSRHSILFGKLKCTFNKTYGDLDPEHYIVVKGLLEIIKSEDVELSMALQNGMILMMRAIEPQAQIFLNSNHFEEEMIFTNTGALEEGLHPYSEEISRVIAAAGEGVAGARLGGVLYLHCNIPEEHFNYKESMLISLYIGMCKLYGNLQCSLQELITRMAQSGLMGDKEFIQRYFEYHNREFKLHIGDNEYNLSLDSKYKLVLCQLDLAQVDVAHERTKRMQLAEKKQDLLALCSRQKQMKSILEIYTTEDQAKTEFSFEKPGEGDSLDPKLMLEMLLKQLSLLDQFSSKGITFQQLVSAMWELNSKFWGIHSEEVVELVEDIKDTLKLKSCMIINQNFALIVAEKSKYTELLLYLRQKLKKGELKSKSLFKIEEQLVQSRWGSDQNIGQKMFTSVPSEGVSVFDPSQSIWFE